MRVLMLAPGTRGDVAPFAGLGARMRGAGHDVVIVADAPYAQLAQDAGCAFHPVPADLREVISATWNSSRRLTPGALRTNLREQAGYFGLAATTALAAAPGAEVVLVNAVAPFGHDIAEGLGVPSVGAFLQPMEPSAAYPPVLVGMRGLGGPGNRLAGTLLRVAPALYDAACAQVRRELGLPKETRRAAERRRRRAGQPVHHGISPVVLPRPRDWRPELHLDGFWWPLRPPGWIPPSDLADFLAAGSAPVVIGFGSTGAGERESEIAVAAARQAGVRAIIQDRGTGERDGAGERGSAARSSGIAERSDSDLLRIGDVPHEWLFAQAAAVVHHAGAGTTAAGLRAGVPTVAVPVHTDQTFWGARVAALGAGPPLIPFSRLTSDRLADAISTAVTSANYRCKAREIAAQLATEDGAAGMLAELERLRQQGSGTPSR